MPLITRLVAGRKNPGRVNIYCDGMFVLALSLDEVVKHGLKKGVELSAQQLTELKNLDTFNKLYAKTLNYLSFRPHTIIEVKSRLKSYGVTDSTLVDSLITKLVAGGYLDDLAFAGWFVTSRMDNRPRSKLHLIAELRAKGVGSDVIGDALQDLDDGRALGDLIRKKLTLPRPKLINFLLRRGFNYQDIQAKLDDLGIKG